MRTKNKMIVFVEIAIVLCSLFLVALPATTVAAEQDDYVLGIYGNANEDDTIDMRDLTYVKLIFFGKKPETELADAKYDGKINPLDFIQIKLIIVGKEKELTFVDYDGVVETVHKPLNRIVVTFDYHARAVRTLGAKDRIVGVDDSIKSNPVFFPELSEKPCVGLWRGYDLEAILELEPDAVITFTREWLMYSDPELEEKIEMGDPDIDVFALMPRQADTYKSEMTKLGYILGERDVLDEFIDWHDGYLDTITERVEGLPEEDKPLVYGCFGYGLDDFSKTYGRDSPSKTIETAGGINIADDIPGSNPEVDSEWVIVQNPSIIIRDAMIPFVGYSVDDPSSAKTIRDNLMNQAGWGAIDAVKEGDVYIMAADFTPHGLYLLGVTYMAKWFHPDLFEDLDPQAVHQEYIDRFCPGLDYDVTEHGVFVYHPKKHPDGS